MAQSKAHIKASNKYNKEHYAKFQANSVSSEFLSSTSLMCLSL